MPDQTEAKAIAELTARAEVRALDIVDQSVALLPPGWTAQRLYDERLLPLPSRHKGSVKVHDAASFIAAVQQRQLSASPVFYADEESHSLAAVLNDDSASNAGWRDYRIELLLRETPEWKHWKSRDGQQVEQATFAEHIEDGLAEIIEPSSADMMEIAQTFHATTTGKFKSAGRLHSGRVQFQYEEDGDATAGERGVLAIPGSFKLRLRPFIGSGDADVTALFRYRITRDVFSLGYKLSRPHEVERAAFLGIVDTVRASFSDSTVLSAPAPQAR